MLTPNLWAEKICGIKKHSAAVTAPQTPWYRNPIAVTGYAAQAFGILMVVASVLVTMPGLPPWVITVSGVTLAVGSKLGLDAHSAQVRVAELNLAASRTAP